MAFDFVNFSTKAIKTIDEIRAVNSTPQNVGAAVEKVESRINAFYRALGLPSFGSSDENNSGNYFKTEVSDENLYKLFIRENSFLIDIPEDTVKGLLDYNKLKVDDGIKFNGDVPKRLRGSLIPMFVNGNILIFPKNNRVSGAFHVEDWVVDDIVYKRPLIELIALLRLRGSELSNKVVSNIIKNDFSFINPDLIGTVNFNVITSQISVNLLKIVSSDLPDFINKTVKEINNIRKQIRTSFKAEIANIPSEQPIELDSDQNGSLEKLKSIQEDIKGQNDVYLSLLEFDDSISNGKEITRNMKEAILSSSILDMIQVDSNDINNKISEETTRFKKLQVQLKTLQQKVDMILGIYSGISGIDILIVITALFLISEDNLLGLMNSASLDRLEDLKGTDFTGSDVLSSILALESKVNELYNELIQKIE